MPEVSFIMAVWNRPELLERCMRSLTKLTHPNYELIVVDDGETSLKSICQEYTDKLPIQYIRMRNRDARSPNIAWNTGYAQSSGDFVIFTNGDLIISEGDLIERFLKHYQGLRMSVLCYRLGPSVMGALDGIDWYNHPELIKTLPGFWDEEVDYATNSIRLQAGITTYMTGMDRKTWDWFGGFRNEDTHLVADQDLVLREIALGIGVDTLPDYCCYHQFHPAASVKTAPSYIYKNERQARLLEPADRESQ